MSILKNMPCQSPAGSTMLQLARAAGDPSLLADVSVFFPEAVNASGSVDKTLLAGVKGVAIGAYFQLYLCALGGEGFNFIAAGAADFGLVYFGMNFFFHNEISFL